MGFLKNFFVKRQIKASGFREERHSVPLASVRRCIVLLDVEDAESDACLKFATTYFGGRGIELKPFFLDMGKHGKDDIKEAGVNTECGLSIKSFNDVVEGDLIETFEQVEVAKTL